jgi:hypothetical protein
MTISPGLRFTLGGAVAALLSARAVYILAASAPQPCWHGPPHAYATPTGP